MQFGFSSVTEQVPGSSSNHALFRNVSQGFSQLARRSRLSALSQARDNVEHSELGQAVFERPRPVSSPHTLLLPSEDELIKLLKRFFISVGAVVPCIDEGAFLQYWQDLSKDKTRVIPRTVYTLVNIMMAHASATLPDGNPMLFYRRSSDLLDMQILQSTDIYTGRLLSWLRLQHLVYR